MCCRFRIFWGPPARWRSATAGWSRCTCSRPWSISRFPVSRPLASGACRHALPLSGRGLHEYVFAMRGPLHLSHRERSDRVSDPGEGLRTIDRPYPLTPTLSPWERGPTVVASTPERRMIEISHVDKWYGPSFQALKDCTTSVAKGEVVVVCGPSGSGKSTLIKCVNALEAFQGGEIILDGIKVTDPKTDLPKLRARVGMVFQHFELFPHLKIIENLCLAQEKVLGRSHQEALAKASKLLDRVGLKDHAP